MVYSVCHASSVTFEIMLRTASVCGVVCVINVGRFPMVLKSSKDDVLLEFIDLGGAVMIWIQNFLCKNHPFFVLLMLLPWKRNCRCSLDLDSKLFGISSVNCLKLAGTVAMVVFSYTNNSPCDETLLKYLFQRYRTLSFFYVWNHQFTDSERPERGFKIFR